MQTSKDLQKRPVSGDRTGHRGSGGRAGALMAAVILLALLPGMRLADAGDLDSDTQSFAVASVARQNALALRLASGQNDNLKVHLESLRSDACGPTSVRLSFGQTDAMDDWEKLLDDAGEAARSKTLQSSSKADECANAARAWTGGSVTLANDALDGDGRYFERFESNLSAGLDARLAADLAVGMAIGGSNGDTIESDGDARSRSAVGSFAAYASYHPSEATFAEAALGVSRLHLSDRVDGDLDELSGDVDHGGLGGYATVAVGRVEQLGGVELSPYLKAAGQVIRLEAARQTIGSTAYRTHSQLASSVAGTVGVDASVALRRLPDWIAVKPKAGVEIGYSLSRQAATAIAAEAGAASGTVPGTFSTAQTLRLDVGTSIKLFDELSLDFDVESRPIEDGRPKTLRLSSSWNF